MKALFWPFAVLILLFGITMFYFDWSLQKRTIAILEWSNYEMYLNARAEHELFKGCKGKHVP